MTTYTLFNQATPGSVTSGTGNNGTNGLHVTVSAPSILQGMWHYSPSPSTQLPTTIGLYTVTTIGTSGTLVHSETPAWSGAAGSGWVFAPFVNPPALQPGTDYMATQFRNDAVNEWFCFYTITWPVTSGIITAPKDVGTGQGWYNVGTTMVFPTTQLAGDNFGMDVQVVTGSFTPVQPARRSKLRKSRRSSSSGSPVVVPALHVAPFSVPVRAVKGKAAKRKSRSYVQNVPFPLAPLFGVFLQSASVTVTAYPVTADFPGGSDLLTASSTVTAYPMGIAPHVFVHLPLAHSTVTAYPINAIPPTVIPLPVAKQIVTAYRLYPPNPLIMSLAPYSGTDQFGNAYVAGFHIYSGTTNGSVISLQSTNATFGAVPTVTYLPPSVSSVSLAPQTFSYQNNAGLSNQAMYLIHSSGKTNSKDDAAVQLLGQAGDASAPAEIIFEFGGTIAQTITKTLSTMNVPFNSIPIVVNGTVLSPTGKGQLYVTTTGDLGYYSPAGTATIIVHGP